MYHFLFFGFPQVSFSCCMGMALVMEAFLKHLITVIKMGQSDAQLLCAWVSPANWWAQSTQSNFNLQLYYTPNKSTCLLGGLYSFRNPGVSLSWCIFIFLTSNQNPTASLRQGSQFSREGTNLRSPVRLWKQGKELGVRIHYFRSQPNSEFSTLKFSHLPLTHPQTVLVTLLGGLHSLGVTSGSLSLPLPAPAPEESPLHHWLPAHDALPILSCLISTSLWSYKLIPFLFFCCKYSIIKAASGVKHIFTLLLLVTSSALFNLSLGRFLKLSHHHNLDTVLTWWTCTGHTWFSQS